MERHKDPERSNCLHSGFVLQMCFAILGYPAPVIGMINMLKGSENLKEYDRLVQKICEEQGWDYQKVQCAVLANCKYVEDGANIEDNFEVFGEDDDPFTDYSGPMLFSSKSSSPTIASTPPAPVRTTPLNVPKSMLSVPIKTELPKPIVVTTVPTPSPPAPIKKFRTASDFLPKSVATNMTEFNTKRKKKGVDEFLTKGYATT